MTVARITLLALLPLGWPLALIAQESLKPAGIDTECEQQYTAASTACAPEVEASAKSCLQRNLSAKCAAEVNAPPSEPRDASCMQEFNAAAVPCVKEHIDASDRCTQSRLSVKCRAQLTAAMQKAQVMQQRCTAEMKQRAEQLRRCLKLATGPEQNACVASITKDESACAR